MTQLLMIDMYFATILMGTCRFEFVVVDDDDNDDDDEASVISIIAAGCGSKNNFCEDQWTQVRDSLATPPLYTSH